MVDGSWTYDKVPEKYKKHIELPKLNEKYLKGSPFEANGQDKGQCTEFTWAMMNQLYPKEQPAFDGITNGQDVHKIYSKRGAKTTHNPTVGYGFSSTPPYALAKIPGVGHTGVVAGVMDDGKFIIAQYNVDPDPAPSRTVLYSVIDGVPKDAGDDLIFFEGVGGEPRKEYKKK
ncbi:CHAP domain-containing protein [Staphylococcus capitis]|uniref:CHAP domain-containing protein n=2 Tax=Staphylococcus TaxID=1279 RepID=A0A8B2ZKK5_STAWA|nr:MULTISPECIES: CHAP domain-containing protein [Staphylococcus]MDH9600751.1 CHAP domain-containing protein [Staphylococcus capitis]MDH9624335.1 CHAP domain-containing protein [Staphylococcus capitis]RGM28356.1 CHAP domain-containing protein [Staphylococcus warneri]